MKTQLGSKIFSVPIISVLLSCLTSVGFNAAEAPEKTLLTISTMPGLRFDLIAFSVKPGAAVELTFTNEDEMAHNLVITTPGARQEIVNAALLLGANAEARAFVPDSPKVLWATKLVAGSTSTILQFKAPEALGDYPYVCTFPGHGFVMFGTMVVTTDPKPPVRNIEAASVPVSRTAIDHAAMGHLPQTKVIRQFMPNAGPASIAVGLPGDYSYCWDAGACRFRYAWQGGFVEEVYRRPERLVGEVFYREEAGFPLRIGSDPMVVPDQIQFRGYSFDAMGSPEFEYEVNGLLVQEFIEVREGLLVRRFRTNAAGKTVWFAVPADRAAQVSATGMKENSGNAGPFFKFEGAEAKEFYVTISPPAK